MIRKKSIYFLFAFLIILITGLPFCSCLGIDSDSLIQDIFYDDITEYLYVANEEGIDIYDISFYRYNDIEKIGSYSLPNIMDIRAWNNRLFVVVENYGLYGIDVSNLNNIHQFFSYFTANHGNTGIDLYDDYGIALANEDLGVFFIDANTESLVGDQLNPGEEATKVFYHDNYYPFDSPYPVAVMNIAPNKFYATNYSLDHICDISLSVGSINAVTIPWWDGYVLIASEQTGLTLINTNNLTNSFVADNHNMPCSDVSLITAYENYAIIATNDGIEIIDIDYNNPSLIKRSECIEIPNISQVEIIDYSNAIALTTTGELVAFDLDDLDNPIILDISISSSKPWFRRIALGLFFIILIIISIWGLDYFKKTRVSQESYDETSYSSHDWSSSESEETSSRAASSSLGKSRTTYKDANGYYRYIDSNMLVHRSVAQKKLRRKLRKGEVVHHKNRKKWDNNPDNLEVMSEEEHNEIHKNYLKRKKKKEYR